MIEFMLIY